MLMLLKAGAWLLPTLLFFLPANGSGFFLHYTVFYVLSLVEKRSIYGYG